MRRIRYRDMVSASPSDRMKMCTAGGLRHKHRGLTGEVAAAHHDHLFPTTHLGLNERRPIVTPTPSNRDKFLIGSADSPPLSR